MRPTDQEITLDLDGHFFIIKDAGAFGVEFEYKGNKWWLNTLGWEALFNLTFKKMLKDGVLQTGRRCSELPPNTREEFSEIEAWLKSKIAPEDLLHPNTAIRQLAERSLKDKM